MKETAQTSNWTPKFKSFGRKRASEKCRVPYISCSMQAGSAPSRKWEIGPKPSVLSAVSCKARNTCIRMGTGCTKGGNFPHWWKQLCFPSCAGLEIFDAVSVFIAWRRSGLVADPEPQTSTHKGPLVLLLPTSSLGCLFPRVNPQNHHSSCGVETYGHQEVRTLSFVGSVLCYIISIPCLAGLCGMSLLLSLAQTPWFRVCIRLVRKQWKVTALTYYYSDPYAQLCWADSSWNLFCTCVTPLTWCCVRAGCA